MCLCACHCCSRFCGLLLSTIHGIMAAAGFTSLGYCIGKSNEGMMIAAAVVIVGLLGQYATASGERRTCLLILHIALSFTFAIVLTVLGSLVIADQVWRHIESANKLHVDYFAFCPAFKLL